MTVNVAVPLMLQQTYCYAVPEGKENQAVTGIRVLVPFGKRVMTGYILGKTEEQPNELKEIREFLDLEPLFTETDLEFYQWIANYYLYPLSMVIKTALPSGLTITGRQKKIISEDGSVVTEEFFNKSTKSKTEPFYRITSTPPPPSLKGKAKNILDFIKENEESDRTTIYTLFGQSLIQLKRLLDLELITVENREIYRDPFKDKPYQPDSPKKLNQEQQAAYNKIITATDSGEFSPFLLHGVTGSGKTEIYLQVIAYAIERHKTALVLVPEIALTPQLVGRFRSRFSCGIAVLHSGLSDGERYDEWRRIRRKEAKIVIGARSAIFAPVDSLGVIVIDEEHESSYKQTDGLRYNARDMALVLGKQRKATVILGSATPLVTTVYAARNEKLTELNLTKRVEDRPMPLTRLLDQRGKKLEILTPELLKALEQNLEAKKQSILFLNRRGFATWLTCSDCGHVLQCPNCSVTLTFHQQQNRHICHYCEYSIPAPSVCPECSGTAITLLGMGTERVEAKIKELFPEAGVSRMDRDTTIEKDSHFRIIKELEERKTDILIGTQMIAKGHDFPGVTLVGVISADTTLNLPDFRSSERAFQLVSQVLGRAGRGEEPGEVFVQTFNPEHFALIAASEHDYEKFYLQELEERRDAGYPPFSNLAAILFSSTSAKAAEEGAETAGKLLRKLKTDLKLKVTILGSAKAPLGKIRGRFRQQILLKSTQRKPLHQLLLNFKNNMKLPANVRVSIDIDPVDML
ncbi:MAG: primosomal protein N' [Desulfuromonadales bacterium]|nr:primosomal protein N' [Desulfuromonadales bacterium]